MSDPKLPAQMGTPETIEKVMDAQIEMRLKPYMWFIKGFSACIGLLAIAGLSGKSVFLTPLVRWAYPPEVISSDLASLAGGYDIEKFGHQFFKTFGDHVDSGYSKTMIFEPNATPSDNYVLF